MKVTDKSNEKKRKIKKKPIDKNKKQQVLVVAQEIKFARLLSGNEKKTRDRVLRALKKWLVNCFEKNYEFKEDDFTRVWKGLFYAVWMSDKPLVQEDLCESIAGILDLFPTEQLPSAMLLAKAGFKMLATEWFGIDQHRIDKFLMLVRRYLRGALRCVHRSGWTEDACNQFANMLAGKDGLLSLKTPLYARNANSLVIHIADCYLEEISKVSSGEISPESLVILLRPFIAYLSQGSAPAICIASRRVLTELLKHGDTEDAEDAEEDDDDDDEQGSDEEDAADDENGDDDDEVMTNGALDPRAGLVDVVLRPLPVPAVELVAVLKQHLVHAKGAGNRRARRCIQLLEQFSSGSHPFAPPSPALDVGPPLKPTKTAKALRALEKKLVANGDELALRGLSRKHRKRLLAKSRAGLSIVEDVQTTKQKPKTSNGDWQVEETGAVIKNKTKLKRANKENEAEPINKKQKLNKVENTGSQEKKVKNNVKKQKNDKVKDNVKNNVKPVKNDVKDVKNSVKKVKSNVKDAKHNVKEVKNSGKVTNDLKVKNSVNIVKASVKNVNVADKKVNKLSKKEITKHAKNGEAKLLVNNKVKKFQKQDKNTGLNSMSTPKKVKFVLKNNSMQGTVDYYKSIRESPNIPFDSSKRPSKTNLKVSTPSPINPFFKKKMTRRASFGAQIVF
ncbi:ribosomal RNA processing protein 1 homolog [Cydia fagiglandana]|uniref:ribosomal RNA processing protein 1 homolog n=1 Tax=Cydia fagiglandana TaxID=1458189 RepID=UPI002FEE106B